MILLQFVERLLREPYGQQGVVRERVRDGASDPFDGRDGGGGRGEKSGRRRRRRRGSGGAFPAEGDDGLRSSGEWAPALVSGVRRGRRRDAGMGVSIFLFEQQAREREEAFGAPHSAGGGAPGPDLE